MIDALGKDERIRLVAEPENPYDPQAIRVEALFQYEAPRINDEGEPVQTEWQLIGYVPRKETLYFHLLRKLGVTLYLKMFVNHDAGEKEKLLVRVSIDAMPEAAFQCERA